MRYSEPLATRRKSRALNVMATAKSLIKDTSFVSSSPTSTSIRAPTTSPGSPLSLYSHHYLAARRTAIVELDFGQAPNLVSPYYHSNDSVGQKYLPPQKPCLFRFQFGGMTALGCRNAEIWRLVFKAMVAAIKTWLLCNRPP